MLDLSKVPIVGRGAVHAIHYTYQLEACLDTHFSRNDSLDLHLLEKLSSFDKRTNSLQWTRVCFGPASQEYKSITELVSVYGIASNNFTPSFFQLSPVEDFVRSSAELKQLSGSKSVLFLQQKDGSSCPYLSHSGF